MTDRPEPGVDELRQALTSAEQSRDLLRTVARRTAAEAEADHDGLRAATAELARLRSVQRRPTARVGVAVDARLVAIRDGARSLRRALRSGLRRIVTRRQPSQPRPSQTTEPLLIEALKRQAAGSPATRGPLVSIVMLNRNGASLLRKCLPGLAATAYADVELIVIDNASIDDSLAVIDAFRPAFPVRLIQNRENASFSAGNNQGVHAATGQLVLLINNDVDPVDPGWLGHMVDTIQATGAVAVGARLVYPASYDGGSSRVSPLSLQHGGVHFRALDGIALAAPTGAGEPADIAWSTEVREVPAVTAACMLVQRAAFDAAGGFAEEYFYGQEDVDLCLRLREQGGRIVYDGRAVLWHHESATRGAEAVAARRARVTANRDVFVRRWAPRLFRTTLLDTLDGPGFWRKDPIALHVMAAPAGAMGTGDLAVAGWRPTGTPAGADILVVTDPAQPLGALPAEPVRVAWVTGDAASWLDCPWLPDVDVVLTETTAAADALAPVLGRRPLAVDLADPGRALRNAIEAWLRMPHLAIRIAVPEWHLAPAGGDLHFARDLQRGLARLGYPARVLVRSEWESWAAARPDAVVHLLGLADGPHNAGQARVLWHISHPDRASAALYSQYDAVFVASAGYAAELAGRLGPKVRPLLQATDLERFRPGAPGPAHELLFVGNSRGVRRHLLDDLLPTPHALAVYGKGWRPNLLDPAYVAAEHVPNDVLAGYYANADIVLNDHWADMQREGFLSNRLFDASAAGAFVITDEIEGLAEAFDGGVVAYRDRDELARLLDHYLANPAERRALTERARAATVARHTFDLRAQVIAETLDALLGPHGAAVIPGPGVPRTAEAT
jgi:GT2 family glycosyltransferase